ncbi:ankyrin repeat domain-containing protein 33B-like [Xyrichtys novacula]|uniref:Ankyrin repeat domain-containing protein 33B-like n=1 Tax=Xyrichtys novacula TaxID=13765 RepID=A0AAV1GYB7_XYRNO|nr:ankyrin repeat domain-containing protein 33B-like [Xyrichtys novacula]
MLRAQVKSDEQTGTKFLLEAISRDQVHLARFVLDALDGGIVDSKSDSAQTPLISSILLSDSLSRCKFVELLLQRGASVNCQDAHGRTALSYACERGCLDAVKILVRNNADPEIEDAWGNTALMYAAVSGHSAVVEFLVRAFKRLGLQVDRQNKAGNSAVEVAKCLGHTECISALTHSSKKNRETEGRSLRCRDLDEKFQMKLGPVVNKLEVLQTSYHVDYQTIQTCDWQQRPWMKQSRLPSMDSIEEFEREDDSFTSSPQKLVFSGVLTPKPPPRSLDRTPNPKQKDGERLTPCDDLLPPLTLSCEAQKSLFFSPRPGRNSPKRNGPSALEILLTPILAKKNQDESETSESNMLDVHRFHESYYQKRCSLPNSILSPTPPERTLVPLRKSRTIKRREASPCKTDPLQSTSTSTTTLTKLLRRFTSPEFKKDVKLLEKEDLVKTSGLMPRSETFPQISKHPKVGSKSSVDSISSVKCEFDFHVRK